MYTFHKHIKKYTPCMKKRTTCEHEGAHNSQTVFFNSRANDEHQPSREKAHNQGVFLYLNKYFWYVYICIYIYIIRSIQYAPPHRVDHTGRGVNDASSEIAPYNALPDLSSLGNRNLGRKYLHHLKPRPKYLTSRDISAQQSREP